MKFISSTIIAALATIMASSVSVSADLPAPASASGGKSRKLSAKSSGKMCGDDDIVQKATIVATVLTRQGFLVFPYLGKYFDSQPGTSLHDLAIIQTVFGADIVQRMKAYESQYGNGDGVLQDNEILAFYLYDYYGNTCIQELIEKLDQLPAVPESFALGLVFGVPTESPGR